MKTFTGKHKKETGFLSMNLRSGFKTINNSERTQEPKLDHLMEKDIEAILRHSEVGAVEPYLGDLVYSDISKASWVSPTGQGIVRNFQNIIEYLLLNQDSNKEENDEIQSEYREAIEHAKSKEKALKANKLKIQRMKQENKKKEMLIHTYKHLIDEHKNNQKFGQPENKTFNCNECPKQFKEEASLDSHVSRRHQSVSDIRVEEESSLSREQSEFESKLSASERSVSRNSEVQEINDKFDEIKSMMDQFMNRDYKSAMEKAINNQKSLEDKVLALRKEQEIKREKLESNILEKAELLSKKIDSSQGVLQDKLNKIVEAKQEEKRKEEERELIKKELEEERIRQEEARIELAERKEREEKEEERRRKEERVRLEKLREARHREETQKDLFALEETQKEEEHNFKPLSDTEINPKSKTETIKLRFTNQPQEDFSKSLTKIKKNEPTPVNDQPDMKTLISALQEDNAKNMATLISHLTQSIKPEPTNSNFQFSLVNKQKGTNFQIINENSGVYKSAAPPKKMHFNAGKLEDDNDEPEGEIKFVSRPVSSFDYVAPQRAEHFGVAPKKKVRLVEKPVEKAVDVDKQLKSEIKRPNLYNEFIEKFRILKEKDQERETKNIKDLGKYDTIVLLFKLEKTLS